GSGRSQSRRYTRNQSAHFLRFLENEDAGLRAGLGAELLGTFLARPADVQLQRVLLHLVEAELVFALVFAGRDLDVDGLRRLGRVELQSALLNLVALHF